MQDVPDPPPSSPAIPAQAIVDWATANGQQIVMRYWLAFTVSTAVAAWVTRQLKIAFRDYLEAKHGTAYRPWYYRWVLMAVPVPIATGVGALVGLVEYVDHTAGEGAFVGLLAGIGASGTVTLFKAIRRKAAKTAGIDIESTSEDLTLEPMPAVKRGEVPTDPVVTDVPELPIGASDDIPTDKPGAEDA